MIKLVSEKINLKKKSKEAGVLAWYIGNSYASILGSLFIHQWTQAEIPGWGVIRADEKTIRAR